MKTITVRFPVGDFDTHEVIRVAALSVISNGIVPTNIWPAYATEIRFVTRTYGDHGRMAEAARKRLKRRFNKTGEDVHVRGRFFKLDIKVRQSTEQDMADAFVLPEEVAS